jgi:UDP-4-amino-4,6-dideoxy-N-acetyl-beta-L-altrosamine N-acetyltransferase
MIVGKRVRLRGIELEDLPLMVTWRNDPGVYRYFFEHEPLSLVSQRRWFENLIQKTDERFWIIETVEPSLAIGYVALVHIDWRNRKAEFGRLLIFPENYRREGYGAEAESLVLRYAFDHMNLNRLQQEVFAENERMIHLQKKLGFKEEGVFRQYIFKNGDYRDVVYLALLREEYLSTSRRIISNYLDV